MVFLFLLPYCVTDQQTANENKSLFGFGIQSYISPGKEILHIITAVVHADIFAAAFPSGAAVMVPCLQLGAATMAGSAPGDYHP